MVDSEVAAQSLGSETGQVLVELPDVEAGLTGVGPGPTSRPGQALLSCGNDYGTALATL